MHSAMTHEFDAVLHRLEGKIAWTVLYVPFSVPDLYGTQNRLEVKGTVDGHSFRGTLLPSRNGHYLVCSQAIRSACKKTLGDSVHVTMEPDTAPRTVEVPEDVRGALAADKTVLAAFEGQPEYIKREQVTKIAEAKRPETRQKRIAGLLELLSRRGAG
jgi:hypothetical protein